MFRSVSPVPVSNTRLTSSGNYDISELWYEYEAKKKADREAKSGGSGEGPSAPASAPAATAPAPLGEADVAMTS